MRLAPGECNTFDGTVGCYDTEGQSTLRAILLRAKDCEIELAHDRAQLIELATESAWYENQWLWFGVGLVIGAGTVTTVAVTK